MTGTVFGHGVYVPGRFVCSEGGQIVTPEYAVWSSMLERCFSGAFQLRRPTYKDCTCSPTFLEFQHFAAWAVEQKGFVAGAHLDKDLLVPGNKHYSEETCVFLPMAVNMLLTISKKKNNDLPPGVFYDSNRKKFVAQLNRESKYVMIGRYTTVDAAFAAYKQAKEIEVKRVAELHKDVLDTRAYQALIHYKVQGNNALYR